MIFKNKKAQQIAASLILALMLAPAFLLPAPKKAEAGWPVVDWLNAVFNKNTTIQSTVTASQQTLSTATDLKNFAKEIAKEVLRTMAKKFLQQMTKSTINWINSGFHGKPLFVENPESFFKDIAKYEVRNFVDMIGYNNLNYPFGKQIALDTIYTFKRKAEDNFQYSLSKYTNDQVYIDGFRADFAVGGFDGFLLTTQYPQINPYGFRIITNEYLSSKLAGTVQNAAQKTQTALDQGMGFLSPQVCPSNPKYDNLTNPWNPPRFKPTTTYNFQATVPNMVNGASNPAYEAEKRTYDSWYENEVAKEKLSWSGKNDCPDGLVNTTPGSVVASQVTNAMGSQFRQSELAAAMGNSISQIVDALISKFMSDGLNSLASKVNRQPDRDNWDYYGNTLGTVQPYNSTSWDAGPDGVIVLSEVKNKVATDIANTQLEIGLLNETSKTFSQIWPKARDLDMCVPGPDLNWEERVSNEVQRDTQKLQEKMSDSDGTTAERATRVFQSLNYAVSFFNDWVKNKMMLDLPYSVLYLDEVESMENLSRQSVALSDKKRLRSQTLARLKSIQTSLNAIASDPAPGSAGEKTLIALKNQYDATSDTIANSYTIEDSRNSLNVAKDQLTRVSGMIGECQKARTAKGWANNYANGKGESKFKGGKTEKELFCSEPIKSGFSHGERSSSGGLGGFSSNTGKISYIFKNRTNDAGIAPYQEIPLVNADGIFSYGGCWGFCSHDIDTTLECNAIWKSNVLDYKGSIPGVTSVSENPILGLSGTSGNINQCTIGTFPPNPSGVAVSGTNGVATIPGWNGGLAYNPDKDQWFLVTQGTDASNGSGDAALQPWARIMSSTGTAVTPAFHIEKGQLDAWEGGPAVAYSTKDKKYLVTWYGTVNGKTGTKAARFYDSSGNPIGQIFDAMAGTNEPVWASSKLEYDPVDNIFIQTHEAHTGSPIHGGLSIRQGLIRIGGNGQHYPIIDLTRDEYVEDRTGPIAIKPGVEYCSVTVRTPGEGEGITDNTVMLRRIDAKTGQVGTTTEFDTNVAAMSITYNPDMDQYLLIYGANGPTTYGAFIDSGCSSVLSRFKIRDNMGAAHVAYNPTSKTYGVLAGEQNSAANVFMLVDKNGGVSNDLAVFTDAPINGNFTSGVKANTRDGTFAISSSQDYNWMRFIPKIFNSTTTGSKNGCVAASAVSTSCVATTSMPSIAAQKNLGFAGTFPDPVIFNGGVYVAIQQGPPGDYGKLNLYNFAMDLTDQKVTSIPFSGVGRAFQRLTVHNNVLWMAFRDGENSAGVIPEHIKLWRSDTGAIEDLGAVTNSGNRPVAVGNGYIAWQGSGKVMRRALTGGQTVVVGNWLPTGLTRINSDGSVGFYDEDLNAVNFGVSASFAGSMAVATDVTPDDNGIVGRLDNAIETEFHLWSGEMAHDPRVATDGNGNYVVATWQPTVRLAVVKATENQSCTTGTTSYEPYSSADFVDANVDTSASASSYADPQPSTPTPSTFSSSSSSSSSSTSTTTQPPQFGGPIVAAPTYTPPSQFAPTPSYSSGSQPTFTPSPSGGGTTSNPYNEPEGEVAFTPSPTPTSSAEYEPSSVTYTPSPNPTSSINDGTNSPGTPSTAPTAETTPGTDTGGGRTKWLIIAGVIILLIIAFAMVRRFRSH